MNLDETLAALERATGYRPRPSGTGYQAKCPAHDDRNPSLSIREGDGGKVLLKCHAGCDWKDVRDRLGMDNGQASKGEPSANSKHRTARELVSTYPYQDADGRSCRTGIVGTFLSGQ